LRFDGFLVSEHRNCTWFRADIITDAAGCAAFPGLEFGVLVPDFIDMRTYDDAFFRTEFHAEAAPFALFRLNGDVAHHILKYHIAAVRETKKRDALLRASPAKNLHT
jgi:hypothetical protein